MDYNIAYKKKNTVAYLGILESNTMPYTDLYSRQ